MAWINRTLNEERDRWILWIPCALASGIGFFFVCWDDPLPAIRIIMSICTCVIIGTICIIMLQPRSYLCLFCAWALFWSCTGFVMCTLRTQYMQTRPLSHPLPAQWITGTIQSIDHPASSKRLFQRIVMNIQKTPNQKMPRQAIMTIRTQCQPLYIGNTIRIKAVLSPVQSAYLPSGYNHKLVSFFKGIGATGFAVSKPIILSRKERKWCNIRHHITRQIYKKMPKTTASLASGLITGDKAGIAPKTREAFSQAGLSHLLAISGLHISSLTAMVFYLSRFFLARWHTLALFINIDRIAGIVSIGLTGFYLMLSGQSLSAIRAFSMSCASIVCFAALRYHHSMRTLMLCAACFLILRPESILSLSYQMSFVAVLGLLSFSEMRRNKKTPLYRSYRRKRWSRGTAFKRYLYQSIQSTAVATFALSSITSFHFAHIPMQGIITNIVAIPLTTLLILPLGFLCVLSMTTPWSASWLFHIWSYCLDALGIIASFSVSHLNKLSLWTPRCDMVWFILQTAGLLWLFIWRRPWRFWGGLLWLMSSILGYTIRTPSHLLVDPAHRLVGYADTSNRTLYLSSFRRGKWIAQKWANAFYTPRMRPIPPLMALPRYPGWSLSVNDEAPGLRMRFIHNNPQKSWSLYVPPFGSVWLANPNQKPHGHSKNHS